MQMASEKPKQGDKLPMSASFPQSDKELEPFDLQDGSDDLPGIFDDTAQSAPFFPTVDVHGMPQSYAQEMSFPVIKDDISQCNVFHNPVTGPGYLYEPVSGFSDLVGNLNEFGQYDALVNSVATANIHATDLDNPQIERNTVTSGIDVGGGLQMSKAGREANDSDICRPWLIENQITHAHTAPVSGLNPSSGQMGINISQMYRSGREANSNNIHMPWVFGNPVILPGSTHVLGHNPPINGELRMNNSFVAGVAPSNHPEMLDGNFLTLGYGSNLETRSKYNVSSKDNNQSNKNIVLPMLNTYSGQNVARSSLKSSSNVADGFSSFQKYDGGFARLVPNESESISIGHAQHNDALSGLGQNASGVSHQVWNANEFSSLVQNVAGFSHQAQNIDRSSGLIQNVGGLSKPSRDESVGTLLPLVDRQNYNQIPSSWNLGFGEKMKERFANISPYTSFQGLPTESSIPNNSNQVGLPDAAWFGANGLSPSSSLVRSAIQPASNQLRSSLVGAVRNFCPEPSMVLPFTGVTRSIDWQGQSGEEFPAVNRPIRSCVPSGRFLKRGSPICPPNAPQPWCKRSRSIRPASHLSAPTLLQTSPTHAPLTSVDSLSPLVPRSFPSRPPTAYTSRLSSLPRTSSPHHIKWQGRQGDVKTPQPSGNQCHICKRDLSFTPEGPIHQPEKPITAAVLPCGHHFHDSCLQRITPQDQAQDPPCIPCAMGEKDYFDSISQD
ncbi:uncharacterized protein LOC110672646 [Hevea brasiliensis]|uniref:uncharacterized protein LOC110672646 n=1 Tax=Hevea brasiliensis TaxID=3981 RepID=UPI0025D2DFB6|nr:uncharacterized protein LOC110672646 [Hevea brasiliensis]